MLGLAIGLVAVQPQFVLPTLDVPAAIKVLETKQVYVAPGAANIDLDAVTRELTPDMRLVVEPFRQFPVNNQYHDEQVTTPLEKWARKKKIRLVTLEGLQGRYANTRPRNLTELRQQMAYVDATGPALAGIRSERDLPRIDQTFPAHQVLAPTPDRMADLAGKLRQNPVHATTGRSDGYGISARTRMLGRPVRAVLLPPLNRGEPVVDYAPALAREFPDEIVLVAQGLWVDIKGADQQRLDSARNYSYRTDGWAFRRGDLGDIIGSIMDRLADMSRPKPLVEPQSSEVSLVQTLGSHLPLLWGTAAGLLGGGALVGFTLRRGRRRRAEAALRKAKGRAAAAIGELEAVLADTPRRDAAERLVAARGLFERARTAAAMADVERVADEGLGCFGLSVLSSAAPVVPEPVPARQAGSGRRLLSREKYLGVPRWVVGGVLAGVITCVALPFDQHVPPDDVRAIVDGLRDSPVYVKPGGPASTDPEQARRALGDRPIMMVLLPDAPRDERFCGRIAAEVRGTMVAVVFAGDPYFYPSACVAASSGAENGLINDPKFLYELEVAAGYAVEYLDKSEIAAVWVAEYVFAFDAMTADSRSRFPQSPTDTVPRRAAVPEYLDTRQIVLTYGGIVALWLAGAFLVRACHSNHPVCSAEIPAAQAAND